MSERAAGRQSLQRRASAYLLSSWLVLGIAHIALLPAWEGFDETAHYSYVQQLVETRQIPQGPSARMSQVVQRYASLAPMPFGQRGRWTYDSFFAQPAPVQQAARDFIHDRPREHRRYAPTGERNWQVQQPPLYYLLIAPAYLATKDASLAAQLFTLRVLSYCFAWFALVIPVGVYLRETRTPSSAQNMNRWPLVATAVWPLLFPVWFPEMARMGNDSLCALMLSLAWWRTVRQLKEGPSARYTVETGVLLGLGCLTKAFFVPVAGALSVFWIVRGWRLGGFDGVRRHARCVTGFVLLATALAAWWYVESWSVFQPVLASEQTGGLLSGLRRNFSLRQAIRGFAA